MKISNSIMLSQVIIPETTHWQQALKNVVKSGRELCDILQISPDTLPIWADPDFPCRVPKQFIEKMIIGKADDPLLLQVLPLKQESYSTSGFILDPLEEKACQSLPGLLHKFESRVLLTPTSACAVNCRYCFRRHFDYQEATFSPHNLEKWCEYISANPKINEVILSGGDPLSCKDQMLSTLVERLSALTQIKRLRIHSRFPVMIPERITDKFCQIFHDRPLQKIFVLHINHPNEIDHHLAKAVTRLKEIGFTILNHSVLLKGVNDNPSTQIDLSEKLFAAGILPYYLNLLDKVQGAAHFSITIDEAKQIYSTVLKGLPGFLCPKLVIEVPGAGAKMPVCP